VEHLLPPGATGALPHIHNGHAEHFHVIDGQITFDHVTGAEAAGAGGTVSVPAGAVHGFRNLSAEPARCLVVLSRPAMRTTSVTCTARCCRARS
jgi:uncharacterized cupin superfamily protein